MGAVLPKPVGKQAEVVYITESGHTIVLGVAGSGKTVMAVHRARYLSEVGETAGSTLLVTFNGALTEYLRSVVGPSPSIDVEQYHLFARRYMRDLGTEVRICGNERRTELVEKALNDIRRGSSKQRAVLDRSLGFFLEEFDWLTNHGVDLVEYVSGTRERTGRRTALMPDDRAEVRKVYNRYLYHRRRAGHTHDWADLASALVEKLASNGGTPHPYRHVVIDEGQDFSPQMIRSLVAAIPDQGSLTFFGDYAQQIYGTRIPWRSLGLRVSRVVRFEKNYRNTRQIARLAKAISERWDVGDEVDLLEPDEPELDGKLPYLARIAHGGDQIAWAAKFASNLVADRRKRTRVPTRRVGVLLPSPDHVEQFAAQPSRGASVSRIHKGMRKWPVGPQIFYGLYADARGLEFDAVILPCCDEDCLVPPAAVQVLGHEEACVRRARELYVAITRARDELVLLHGGSPSSLLPEPADGIYEQVDLA
ncbi:UvrD-helicase domain-containing protein [Nocardia wallacei]|uniref:UvrD-helicase domain-containing protein n=1 Tax=Nocardia wallacei TaxID=480035 RepID=UPI002454DBF1|nr:UvrD-helicase domain-containing protein [Nocardia wallacei]